ncbi:MAG: peptidylprolyl isomerase [Magnetococcales bacterium]|nr:peptidylprolyl isomerase [Magnetococcales bacterium]
MIRRLFYSILSLLTLFVSPAAHADSTPVGHPNTHTGGTPMVVLTTSFGDITLELEAEKAPGTVQNFLDYVDAHFYDGTIFHRVIKGFMIQGGGFTPNMQQKTTRSPIRNEADNGLKNARGTIAMARTAAKDSATAQFFINVVNNAFLDHGSRDFGYAVFGKVVQGMEVVDRIAAVRTGGGDIPTEPVLIQTARRLARPEPQTMTEPPTSPAQETVADAQTAETPVLATTQTLDDSSITETPSLTETQNQENAPITESPALLETQNQDDTPVTETPTLAETQNPADAPITETSALAETQSPEDAPITKTPTLAATQAITEAPTTDAQTTGEDSPPTADGATPS